MKRKRDKHNKRGSNGRKKRRIKWENGEEREKRE